MAKIEQNPGTGRYELAPKSADQTATITNRETGKTLPLKGYGSMKGKLTIRKGVDLTKPIAEQAKTTRHDAQLSNKPAIKRQKKK